MALKLNVSIFRYIIISLIFINIVNASSWNQSYLLIKDNVLHQILSEFDTHTKKLKNHYEKLNGGPGFTKETAWGPICSPTFFEDNENLLEELPTWIQINGYKYIYIDNKHYIVIEFYANSTTKHKFRQWYECTTTYSLLEKEIKGLSRLQSILSGISNKEDADKCASEARKLVHFFDFKYTHMFPDCAVKPLMKQYNLNDSLFKEIKRVIIDNNYFDSEKLREAVDSYKPGSTPSKSSPIIIIG